MKIIETIIDKLFLHKKHHYFHAISEYGRGRIAGKALNKRDAEEAKEVIVRETLCCNFDFLKGLNETLNKDLAKKAYSMLNK